MNAIKLILMTIALSVFSLTALSGSVTIPKTFSTGDTLTASDLNDNNTAIETAVDGNAADIASNTSSISAKVNKSGDTMSGSLTAPDFLYDSSQTRYYVVGINDFVPYLPTYTYSRNDNQLTPFSSGSVIFFAPVHLPDGAIITGVDFYTADNSTTSYINWYLTELVQSTGSFIGQIANVSGDLALAPGNENLSSTGLSHIVDNSKYYYQFRLWFSDGATNILFRSARVTYMISKPD